MQFKARVLAELEELGELAELEVRGRGRRRGRRELRAPLESLEPPLLLPPLELLQVGSQSFQPAQTKSEALPRW